MKCRDTTLSREHLEELNLVLFVLHLYTLPRGTVKGTVCEKIQAV